MERFLRNRAGSKMSWRTFTVIILFFCVPASAEERAQTSAEHAFGIDRDVYEWYVDNYWKKCGLTEPKTATIPSTPAHQSSANVELAKTSDRVQNATDGTEKTETARSDAGVPLNSKTQSLPVKFPSEAEEARSIANQDRLNREFLARRESQRMGLESDRNKKSTDIPVGNSQQTRRRPHKSFTFDHGSGYESAGPKETFEDRLNFSFTAAVRKENLSLRTLVVGGHEATKIYPWMVPIVAKGIDNNYVIWCGSTLISNRHLLSAAHCFSARQNASFFALIRVHELNEPGEVMDIESITIHPDFKKDLFYNDIAIVRLAKQVTNFVPACLPVDPNSASETAGAPAEVLGFGSLGFGDKASESLQVAKLRVFANEDCRSNYSAKPDPGLNRGIVDSQLCAGASSGAVDACQNDSGGPLVKSDNSDRRIVIGIVSFGYQCGREGFPGVYTRVTSYLPWILTAIRN